MSKKGRKRVFLGAPCYYCGGTADTKDHYIPVCRGGTSDVNNLVAACEECNRMKDSLIPEAFLAFCAEVLVLKCPKHDSFRHKARAILRRHAPELIPTNEKQSCKVGI